MSLTKAECAALGGKAVYKKRGRDYMAQIGKKGATATWTKYSLQPVGFNDFAMVNKETGVQVALISGKHINKGAQ